MNEAYASEDLATLELAAIVSSMVLLELATVAKASSSYWRAMWVVSTVVMAAAMAPAMRAIGDCCCTADNEHCSVACMYVYIHVHDGSIHA